MDVYVVSNVWYREGATVIGAAVDLASAEEIAERLPPVAGAAWRPWGDAEVDGKRTRNALRADGVSAATFYQEIVRVPLAGYIGDWTTLQPIDETGPALMREVPALVFGTRISEAGRDWIRPRPKESTAWAGGDPIADLRKTHGEALAGLGYGREVEQIKQAIDILSWRPPSGQATVTYPWADERHDIISAWRHAIIARERATTMRVGTGAAKEWLETAMDRLSGGKTYSAASAASSLMGLSIMLDPDIPPDNVRVGDMVYVICTPEPGRMVIINKAELDRFTNPPS
jgi:hypothetical protein